MDECLQAHLAQDVHDAPFGGLVSLWQRRKPAHEHAGLQLEVGPLEAPLGLELFEMAIEVFLQGAIGRGGEEDAHGGADGGGHGRAVVCIFRHGGGGADEDRALGLVSGLPVGFLASGGTISKGAAGGTALQGGRGGKAVRAGRGARRGGRDDEGAQRHAVGECVNEVAGGDGSRGDEGAAARRWRDGV